MYQPNMGIKNLNKLLRSKCPDIFKPVHISEFQYKKIAIDTSLYLCSYKALHGERWLSAFIKLVACLRKNEVHCVFIYDSGCVAEKTEERKNRRDVRQKMEEKLAVLEDAIEVYHRENTLLPILDQFMRKKEPTKRLLSTNTKYVFSIKKAEYYVEKLNKQCFHIDPEDYTKTKNLFDKLKVPYFDAPLEAETMCADLCKRGLVDAVLTEDTDVLAYASCKFLSKINPRTGDCIQITMSDMLSRLKFTYPQFLDLCIMCGTDYNKNMFRVGPMTSYTLLTKHGSLEVVDEKTKHDTTILKYIRVREIFTDYKSDNLKHVPYCGIPDIDDLSQFMIVNDVNYPIESLKSQFIANDLIIIEEEEI